MPLRYLSELLDIEVQWDKNHPNTATLVNVPNFVASTGMKAGTYNASAQGFHGEVKLAVTVSADKITDIQVVEHSETAGIGEAALPLLVEAVLKDQTIGVDGISGATITSGAFKEAMTAALIEAGPIWTR